MKREVSLLGRLERHRESQSYTTELDIDNLLDNISNNVQNMLNVRVGSVVALDDYGMPDFNDVVKEFPDAITRIRRAITGYINKYEPRLRSVQVHHLHDPHQPLLLKFTISAELNLPQHHSRVNFNTVLTGNGQATVNV